MVGRKNTPDSKSKYWCVVPGCNADRRKKNNLLKYPWMKDVSFEPFPTKKKEPNLRAKWICMIRRQKGYEPLPFHRVCTRHFVGNCRSSSHPIPELFPWNNYKNPTSKRSSNSIIKREKSTDTESSLDQSQELAITSGEFDDCIEIDERECGMQLLPEHIPREYHIPVVNYVTVESSSTAELHSDETPNAAVSEHNYSRAYVKTTNYECYTNDAEIQTDLTMADIAKFESENFTLHEKLEDKETLFRNIFVEKVTKNDRSIQEYIGLPNLEIFNELKESVLEFEPNLKYWSGEHSEQEKYYQTHGKKPGPARKLSRYYEFILTLVRLRLALPAFFLSDVFRVSRSRVSSIFTTWIFYLFFMFKDLIRWPSRDLVKKHMPKSFMKNFPRTRAIIDCSEIFIQKPRDPSVNARTYSTYKSHNTFKFLVSITPTGAFNFISQIWGGNTSDRYITMNSGFLDLVSAGDEIMADRGFTIRDLLTERHAYLTIPPFTRRCAWGKGKYLKAHEIQCTRKIANLRIHVERAIQRLKCFKLISQILPWSMKSLIHPMIIVAGFFCNLKKPLVRN